MSASGRSPISLPLMSVPAPAKRVRASRNARRRWIVLFTVQALMIAHLIQWIAMGRTMTPIEPSESMEAVKYGIVNAGTIFFALALLSTAIFGRWMCGWMCHVVALQDGCAWLLARVGVRPRPFRSRLLLLLPLALALYMFVWPAVYRLVVAPVTRPDLVWPGWRLELTTTEFWQTFPTVLVAIPFLLVCGFAAVYFLGQKGYCSYGCPYGGFFAPLDEIAPARIRVTDACEHCGHCTAVCTSNVRVHEEVRDYGMVVDPGCMKCMDCVSVCPKDALYFGFGAPAVAKKPRVEAPASRKYDLSWAEEIGFAILAALTFFAVRGVYGVVPLLFASGITICVVWLSWKAWRTLREPNAHLHGVLLRKGGALRPAGVALLGGVAAMLLLVAHSGAVNAFRAVAARLDDRVTIPAHLVFGAVPTELPPAMALDAARGERLYGLASFVGSGGIGLGWAWQPEIDMRRAWLLATLHRWTDAEAVLRRSIEQFGDNEPAHAGIARLQRAQLREEESFEHARAVLARHPEYTGLFDETAATMAALGDVAGATALARDVLARRPDDLTVMRRLSLLLSEHGDAAALDEGIALIEETIRRAPENPAAHFALALAFGRRGDMAGAERALRRAIELQPQNPRLHETLGELLRGQGRAIEADAALERARELAPPR